MIAFILQSHHNQVCHVLEDILKLYEDALGEKLNMPPHESPLLYLHTSEDTEFVWSRNTFEDTKEEIRGELSCIFSFWPEAS